VTQAEYEVVAGDLMALARSIEDSKRPGYTVGSEDVLANFKSVAARVGITTEQAFLVYFLKHVDAICTILSRPDLPVSEAPPGRFADAVNYLRLGFAIWRERQDAASLSCASPAPTSDRLPETTTPEPSQWAARLASCGGAIHAELPIVKCPAPKSPMLSGPAAGRL
jgi:hypothetical protein